MVKFVSLEQMEGRRVLVVCNLKAAKMRDVVSSGMVRAVPAAAAAAAAAAVSKTWVCSKVGA